MNIKHIWAITTKDMGILIRKKFTLYSTLIIPLIISIGLPALIWYVENKKNTPINLLVPVINAFSFFFIILAALIPLTSASYSLVGEKVEKSLEPLLATPTSDGEILLGKYLAAIIPCVCMLFIGGGIFMGLMNAVISGNLGHLYYPNSIYDIILFLAVPLTSIFSVELCVIISSRVTDIRSAQQLSYLVLIPFLILYFLIEISVVSLDVDTLFEIAGVIAAIDSLLFFACRVLFEREEILTKWK